MRSHVLAGEPELAQAAPWSGWAWLTVDEVEKRFLDQGDVRLWDGIRGMFGLVSEEDLEAEDEG